jgi:hypothetical protein
MKNLRVQCASALFALIVLTPSYARGQEPAHTLQALQSNLHANDKVRLMHVDGTIIQGKLESVSDNVLTLKVKAAVREYRAPQILTIQTQYNDPIRNGVTIGALVGGGAGAVIGAIVSDAFCDGCGTAQASGALVFGLIGAGIGAGSGALGDSLRKGYKTVYSMPRVSGLRFTVSPVLSQNAKGVAVGLRF